MHQIFYIRRLNRNFWKPKWIKKFELGLWIQGNIGDWGHWTYWLLMLPKTIIMPQQLDIGFIYFGMDARSELRDKGYG